MIIYEILRKVNLKKAKKPLNINGFSIIIEQYLYKN